MKFEWRDAWPYITGIIGIIALAMLLIIITVTCTHASELSHLILTHCAQVGNTSTWLCHK